MLLALDISTSCTGYAVFNKDSLVETGYIALNKLKGLYVKSNYVKRRLTEIKNKYMIKHIAVEENLQAFRPGLSSAKTLMTLAQFNGIVRYICYEIFKQPAFAINVNTARKLVGLNINKKDKSKTTKDKVLDWVQLNEKTIIWPKKVLKSGPRKGTEVYEAYAYDIADAYVIGKAFCIENLQ
jgi:Holliday junction resolvasome RuvABC endonuclease subunit